MNKINYEKRYQMIGRLVDELVAKGGRIPNFRHYIIYEKSSFQSFQIIIYPKQIVITGYKIIDISIQYTEKQWLNKVLAKVDELLNDENTPA